MKEISLQKFAGIQTTLYIGTFSFLWLIWSAFYFFSDDVGVGLFATATLLLFISVSAIRDYRRGAHGFIGKPRKQWMLSLCSNGFKIETGTFATRVMFTELERATISMNASWDISVHQERESLLLRMKDGWYIRVPGSSPGFDVVCNAIDERFGLEKNVFDHDEEIYF